MRLRRWQILRCSRWVAAGAERAREHEGAVRSERLESERGGWIAGPTRSRADRSWRLQAMPQNGRNEQDELLGKCEGDVGSSRLW